MARPRNYSKIQIPPRVKGFSPMGYYFDKSEPVQLNIEEYESIRLLDYENLSQQEAALIMDVSRPTLTRIYDRARKKIAVALTEGLQVTIEGGRAIFSEEWYECGFCHCRFNTVKEKQLANCPLCSHNEILNIGESWK
jgi:predicted DNA-binding protein (UPF0251 family)